MLLLRIETGMIADKVIGATSSIEGWVAAKDIGAEILNVECLDKARRLALQELDHYWENLGFDVGGHTYLRRDVSNLAMLNMALHLESDAEVVDVADITVFIPNADIKPALAEFATQLKAASSFYDVTKVAILNAQTPDAAILAVKDI